MSFIIQLIPALFSFLKTAGIFLLIKSAGAKSVTLKVTQRSFNNVKKAIGARRNVDPDIVRDKNNRDRH